MNAIHLLPILFLVSPVPAAVIEIHQGDSFNAAQAKLKPGDTLIVHKGIYADRERIVITAKGTPSQPIVIKGAAGEPRPHITRLPNHPVQNTINIHGARHLIIQGVEISSNGGDGINLKGNAKHIILDDLEIHSVDVGINFRSDLENITVRNSHIYMTGAGHGTGEGLYIGCNHARCVVSNSVIENNWIHDTTLSSQGDGIEIKKGSHSNIIRNNVIHNTRYPCILVYGTENQPANKIYGNIMWDCGDSGIQAAADAKIYNNLILFNPENGFNSQSHQGVSPSNIEFIHNTIIGGNPCLRLDHWSNKKGMLFANNAIYCESGNYKIGAMDGVTIKGNVFLPIPNQSVFSASISGKTIADDFVDAIGINLYPTQFSSLIDAGIKRYSIPDDIAGNIRDDKPDAGAFEWNAGDNKGKPYSSGFKLRRNE